MKKYAIIIGAGPAGLTAAAQLLKNTDILPILLEREECIGETSHPPCSPDAPAYLYTKGKLLSYPLRYNVETLRSLGLWFSLRALIAQGWSRLFPRRPVNTLQDQLINKWGKIGYERLFKGYAEKVGGLPCDEMAAEESVQHIPTVTAEELSNFIRSRGGKILCNQSIHALYAVRNECCAVHTVDTQTGELQLFRGDHFLAAMPLQDLILSLETEIPETIRSAAETLQYRDCIKVKVQLKHSQAQHHNKWIYIQDTTLQVARVQIAEGAPVTVKMEYYVNRGATNPYRDKPRLQALAIEELEKMGIAEVRDVLQVDVSCIEKAYPAFTKAPEALADLYTFTNRFNNLLLPGPINSPTKKAPQREALALYYTTSILINKVRLNGSPSPFAHPRKNAPTPSTPVSATSLSDSPAEVPSR